jgi:hypothetical protein
VKLLVSSAAQSDLERLHAFLQDKNRRRRNAPSPSLMPPCNRWMPFRNADFSPVFQVCAS